MRALSVGRRSARKQAEPAQVSGSEPDTPVAETHMLDRVGRFQSFMASLELNEYDLTHLVRLTETLRRMDGVITAGQAVMELGGMSRLAEFLKTDAEADIREYTNDLRQPLELDSASFDLVLMLEVLEHLNDRHRPDTSITEIAMFTGSGATSCLQEAYRILKPGGYLILTTPNAASVDTLGRVLLKQHPFQYKPHVREYTLQDIRSMAGSAGFEVVQESTFFAWNSLPGVKRDSLISLISELGFESSDRGDDVFFLLRKPV